MTFTVRLATARDIPALTERFDIPMPDGEVLPAAHMVKSFD